MKKILIIEDDPLTNELLVKQLENNYKPIPTFNGKAGLKLAKQEKPDLIILDLLMSQLNGKEIFFRLKKDPDTKNIPVITLSLLNPKMVDLEPDAFVEKPYKEEVLIRTIEETFKAASM